MSGNILTPDWPLVSQRPPCKDHRTRSSCIPWPRSCLPPLNSGRGLCVKSQIADVGMVPYLEDVSIKGPLRIPTKHTLNTMEEREMLETGVQCTHCWWLQWSLGILFRQNFPPMKKFRSEIFPPRCSGFAAKIRPCFYPPPCQWRVCLANNRGSRGGEKMQPAFFLHFWFWPKVAFYCIFFCILMQLRRRKG